MFVFINADKPLKDAAKEILAVLRAITEEVA